MAGRSRRRTDRQAAGAAGTGPSRQLRRQQRLRAQGLCIICSAPAARKIRKRDGRPFVASRCERCLATQRAHYARKRAVQARGRGAHRRRPALT
jgi:hypothetical protein